MIEDSGQDKASQARRRRRRRRRRSAGTGTPGLGVDVESAEQGDAQAAPATTGSRRRRRGGGGEAKVADGSAAPRAANRIEVRGVFELRKDGTGFLRQPDKNLQPQKDDPVLPVQLVRKFQIKAGSEVVAQAQAGKGAPRVQFIESIDGLSVPEHRRRRNFKKLTVIDPDFHYELGTHPQEGQLAMRILDLLCPLGRGQRGLLVSPPRAGKTTVLQQIAKSMEALYPDVRLIVLLIDERPEEATNWRRAIERGEVFASTMDQSPKDHIALAELVQARAERMVEAGKEVVILLDSLTRLARAYNHVIGSSGKTMSGGLDARTMAKPKHFFAAARNTETAGSLTIVATCLVDTGSRMDQVIFEEFKGTGNMELVLDRRLADRRIFPAIAVDKTGTRKEEKLLTRQTMRKISILRRVLSRMRPLEAMELMVGRLQNFPTNRDFLNAFSMDDVE